METGRVPTDPAGRRRIMQNLPQQPYRFHPGDILVMRGAVFCFSSSRTSIESLVEQTSICSHDQGSRRQTAQVYRRRPPIGIKPTTTFPSMGVPTGARTATRDPCLQRSSHCLWSPGGGSAHDVGSSSLAAPLLARYILS